MKIAMSIVIVLILMAHQTLGVMEVSASPEHSITSLLMTQEPWESPDCSESGVARSQSEMLPSYVAITEEPSPQPSIEPAAFKSIINPSPSATMRISAMPSRTPTTPTSMKASPSGRTSVTTASSSTPTLKMTSAPSNKPTHSGTPSDTAMKTPTPTKTPTTSTSSEPSSSVSPSVSVTRNSTPTKTPTPSPTSEPSSSVSPSVSVTSTPTPTRTPTSAPTRTPTPTPSSMPSTSGSRSATATPSGTPTETSTPSPSSEPSSSVSPSVSVTSTPSPTGTPTPSPSSMPSPGRSGSASARATPSISVSPSSNVAPTLPPGAGRRCVVYGETNGLVVVPMKYARPSSLWARSINKNGLEWRRGDTRTGVDPKGTGLKCFKVRPSSSGHYLLTGVTAAAHGTEHNDVWMWFSGDVYFVKGTKRRGPVQRSFFKAYQNMGAGAVSTMLFSVDHNPHRLVTGALDAGRTYKLCISGRSSKFVVYALALARCEGFDKCKPSVARFGDRVNEGIVRSSCAL